ncbi:Uncharacterised protein [Mycobacteroides abscessus subsp. abscessus]|nr:Uncharacterised protein [Mycobacteroides abscessus subsp. abscessus]
MASSRPVSAALSSLVMVSSCAMPPPLSTTDSEDSTSSVVGYAPARSSGMTSPGRSCPSGTTSVGGLSSTWLEPSKLVWPILAMALAGRRTSRLSETVTRACQSCTSMSVTEPTSTSSTRTGEFAVSVVTFGIWIRI